MAELKGYRLGVDEGGRPVVDDKGQLVYLKVTKADTVELEQGQGLVVNPAKVDPTLLHPENTTPMAAADVTMADGDNPGSFTVPRVTEHLAASAQAERDRVMAAEAAGKARSGILTWTP
jgi:hypothetical protein